MKFILEKVLNRYIYRKIIAKKLKQVGCSFKLGYFSELLNPQYFSIGDYFYSGPFGFFGTNKNNPVEIGDYVMFGPRCTIQGGNHDLSYQGFMYHNNNIDHMAGVIKIGNGAWIGSNTTIISGAEIGEGAVIGAMSLVNKKIPPFVVAAGVPVKIIKPRFNTIEQLRTTLSNTKSELRLDDVLAAHNDFNIFYDAE